MVYITDRNVIEDIFKKSGEKIPKEIYDEVEDKLLRDKLIQNYKFLKVNFSNRKKEGIEKRFITSALYKFAHSCYFEETKGVEEMLRLFARFKLLKISKEEVVEDIITFKEDGDHNNNI